MEVACYRVRGTIRAESPLHIGSGQRAGVIKRCLRYVPGSFLRGSVGISLLRTLCRRETPLKNHEECEFFGECPYAFLMEEPKGRQSKLFFRYAYPLHLKCGSGVYEPAPLTLYECTNPQCREKYDLFAPPQLCTRPKCGSPVSPVRGFMCSGCGAIEQRPVKLSRIVSTAVDRQSQSAASVPTEVGEEAGTLHAIETISKGTVFSFEVIADRDSDSYMQILIDGLRRGLPDEGLGGSKSRGFGKVMVEAETESVTVEMLKKRAECIDSKDFKVILLSPTILDGGQVLEPRTILEGVRRAYSWAYATGKPSLPDVNLVESRFEWEYVGGWSLREGKERRREVALSAGSVFHYRSAGSSVLSEGLAALEIFSIGSFKPHGCGQVRVS